MSSTTWASAASARRSILAKFFARCQPQRVGLDSSLLLLAISAKQVQHPHVHFVDYSGIFAFLPSDFQMAPGIPAPISCGVTLALKTLGISTMTKFLPL